MCPQQCGMGLEFLHICHGGCVRGHLYSFKGWNDMKMQVEHGLARRSFIELSQTDTIGIKGGLAGNGEFLNIPDDACQLFGVGVKQVA